MTSRGGGNPLLTFNTISTWLGADTHRNNDTAHHGNNMGPPAPPLLETRDGGDMFYFQPGIFPPTSPPSASSLKCTLSTKPHPCWCVFVFGTFPMLYEEGRKPLLVTVYYYNYIKIKLIKNPPNPSCGYGLGVGASN